jgi:riboflavin biosynthesis pyrimidine reductase
VPANYLATLREKGISYVVVGESSVDLAEAVDQLGEHSGIRTLLLEGGGRINGAFLQADLVDEVSLLVVSGIDGRLRHPDRLRRRESNKIPPGRGAGGSRKILDHSPTPYGR